MFTLGSIWAASGQGWGNKELKIENDLLLSLLLGIFFPGQNWVVPYVALSGFKHLTVSIYLGPSKYWMVTCRFSRLCIITQ